MNKSQRIYLNVDAEDTDKYIKFKLEQNVDTLEFLSMSVSTKDIYQDFNADYGVVVGRVQANNAIGVPNAKISIFIPLSDEDANNPEIFSIYPYKTPRDKNLQGKRYNLLPRVGEKNAITKIVSPKQPFGSFPIKPEIVTNVSFLNVYKKYYKYTAVTNSAGDYMIFGVPVGTQTVHMSVDITDIGEYSMTPASMITNLGYSPNLFAEDKITIKEQKDINDLPHIETQEITVDVIPFWGDVENFEIGITRRDFRVRALITSTFTIFGSAFTDAPADLWSRSFDDVHDFAICQLYRAKRDSVYGITNKQIAEIEHKIYYYPSDIPDDQIGIDPINQMKVLDPSEYTIHKRDGDFVFIVNCNRNKIIINDIGEQEPVKADYNGGIFTEFKGFMTLEIPTEKAPLSDPDFNIEGYPISAIRFKVKIPQYAPITEPPTNGSFTKSDSSVGSVRWRQQHYTFERDKIYSVAKFHGLVHNNNDGDRTAPNKNNRPGDDKYGFMNSDIINKLNDDPNWNTGVLTTLDDTEDTIQFPTNGTTDRSTVPAFGSNWLNFCIHLPQFGYFKTDHELFLRVHSSSNFTPDFRQEAVNPTPYSSNNNNIAAGEKSTKWFARSDMHWTDFIVVDKEDILALSEVNRKGFSKSQLSSSFGVTLKTDSIYRNGTIKPQGWTAACPVYGGHLLGKQTGSLDTNIYFFKGWGEADCIQFVRSLGIV